MFRRTEEAAAGVSHTRIVDRGSAAVAGDLGVGGLAMGRVGVASGVFGLWRVRFPPCLVRPGRRLPVQGLSEGSLGFLDRLPA